MRIMCFFVCLALFFISHIKVPLNETKLRQQQQLSPKKNSEFESVTGNGIKVNYCF